MNYYQAYILDCTGLKSWDAVLRKFGDSSLAQVSELVKDKRLAQIIRVEINYQEAVSEN